MTKSNYIWEEGILIEVIKLHPCTYKNLDEKIPMTDLDFFFSCCKTSLIIDMFISMYTISSRQRGRGRDRVQMHTKHQPPGIQKKGRGKIGSRHKGA